MKHKNKYLLLLILLLVICSGLVTYALFRTNKSGNANVNAARWNVVFKNGESEIENNFNIQLSNAEWTNPLGNVASGKIAPGSTATFYITIDATNTETSVDYTAEIDESFDESDFEVTLAQDSGTIPYSTVENAMIRQIPIRVVWNGNINDDDNKNSDDLLKKARNITIPIKVTAAQKLVLPYTITFNDGFGNIISTKKINEGDTVGTLPADPTREKYVFLGWYDDIENGNEVTSSTLVTSGMNIYAHWIKTYIVTFNSNGGSSVSPVQVVEGETLNSIPTSEKTDYQFMGWYDSNDNKLTLETIINSDITYTAKWRIPIPVDSDSTLGQNAYDGDLTTNDAMVRNTWKYLKLPNNIEEKKLEFAISAAKLTGTNITVAFFDENKQPISTNYFYTQGNAEPPTGFTRKGTLTTTQQSFKLMIPAGAVYAGFEKYNCNNAAYVYDVYMTDELYYMVTFDSNGGSSVSPVQVVEGETLNSIPTTTKTGYEFLGWFDSNNHMLTSSTKIERSKTYIAKWGVRISITEDSENTLSTNGYDGDMTTYDSMIRNEWKYVKLSSNSTDKKVNIVFKSALDSGTRFAMAFFDSSKQKIGTGYIYYTPDAEDAGFTKIGDLTDETTMATLDIPSNAVYLGVEKVNCNNNVFVYDMYLTD